MTKSATAIHPLARKMPALFLPGHGHIWPITPVGGYIAEPGRCQTGSFPVENQEKQTFGVSGAASRLDQRPQLRLALGLGRISAHGPVLAEDDANSISMHPRYF